MSKQEFIGSNFPVTVLEPDAARYNGNPSTDIVNMENWSRITFIISEGAGGTGTATVTANASDDASASSTTAIAFRYREISTHGTMVAGSTASTSGFTTTAGANKMVIVEIEDSELTAGKPFVYLTLTEVANSAVDAGVTAILSGPRYAQDIGIDPLS